MDTSETPSQVTVHICFHTHWDHEWLQRFEEYRFRLDETHPRQEIDPAQVRVRAQSVLTLHAAR